MHLDMNDKKQKNEVSETTIHDQRGRKIKVRESEIAKLTAIRMSSWYMLAIVLYLGSALLAFGLAYLIVKILIELQLN